jgi:hypothetical protein
MRKTIFKYTGKVFLFAIVFVIVSLVFVALNVKNAEETEMIAYADSWNNGKNGIWPNTLDYPGTYWLNSYCDTNWYMYMSDGGSDDYKSSATECIYDQGGTTSSRYGYHQITVPFGSELSSNMASQNFTFTFGGQMMAGNSDYNTIYLYLEFLNSGKTPILSPDRVAVWGKYGGEW